MPRTLRCGLCPQAAIESALAYGKCLVDAKNKFSCFLDKALVNVGADLSRVVPGRVSTEVDPRLAYDSAALVDKVRGSRGWDQPLR